MDRYLAVLRLLEIQIGVIVLFLDVQKVDEIVPGLGVLRVLLDRRLVLLQGFLVAAQLEQAVAMNEEIAGWGGEGLLHLECAALLLFHCAQRVRRIT